MFVLCVCSKRQKAECRAIKTTKQVRMKYRVKGIQKKNSLSGHGCLCCVLYSKDQSHSQDKQDKEIRIKYRERTKIWLRHCATNLKVVVRISDRVF
jgi:hypothetical protein